MKESAYPACVMRVVIIATIAALLMLGASARAQDAKPTPAQQAQAIVDKAAAFLKSQQRSDGSWQASPRTPPAVTAMAMQVLAQDPNHGPKHETVRRAVEALLKLQKEDGGFYQESLANYNTAIIISGLASLKDPELKPAIDRAVAFLKGTQWTDDVVGPDGQKLNPKGVLTGGWFYGGVGERGGAAADLSNTSVMLDALKDAGLPEDDPAFQNALKFVTRMQNRSESNPSEWAGNDGGFVYHMRADGTVLSAAGEESIDGRTVPRSYGSMTYAGFKSLIYAGLTRDDPRVQAAWQWICENYTLEENPGMSLASPDRAREGIYYYYSVMARALSAYGETTITDPSGERHDWRVELIAALASQQKDDGSFVGERRWMENDPLIATTLATLAIQEAMADLAARPPAD